MPLDPSSLSFDARRAAEQVARESYGRLVAYLAARTRDLASAEDALGEAFHAALENWPRSGIPLKPEAWLLTTARRRMIDQARHAQVHAKTAPVLQIAGEESAEQLAIDPDMIFPDERLKLLFVCAHPAIDPGVRTPLMLQTILGLDASRIASAFLVQPAAMGQRLSRTKTKIRDARIPFVVPERRDLPDRLEAVLQAIYAAYGTGWENLGGAVSRSDGLAVEAIELGRLLQQFMPAEPEVQGLLALMLYCEARRPARRSPDGEYVPLSEQDVSLWSETLIAEADQNFFTAQKTEILGRFQLEAAIQHVHAQRRRTGETAWPAIALLYEGLAQFAPTLGVLVGRVAALAAAHGPERGWRALEEISGDMIKSYQPYWAVRAHLLKKLSRLEESNEAYARAIELCDDPATRAFLEKEKDRLES